MRDAQKKGCVRTLLHLVRKYITSAVLAATTIPRILVMTVRSDSIQVTQ